jgi:hypothetical protein
MRYQRDSEAGGRCFFKANLLEWRRTLLIDYLDDLLHVMKMVRTTYPFRTNGDSHKNISYKYNCGRQRIAKIDFFSNYHLCFTVYGGCKAKADRRSANVESLFVWLKEFCK